MFISKHNVRRRAVVIAQVAVLLPVLLGLAVITVDVGAMYNARGDLQRAADAAALAAAAEYAYAGEDEDPTSLAVEAAQDFVGRSPVMGRTVSIDTETDIVFGRAYYDEFDNSYNFVPGDAGTNAIRVTVRHSEESPNGPLPLYFAGVFGKSATNVSASSVAIFVRTCYEEGDCYDVETEGSTIMCHYGDSDDSDSEDSDGSQDGDSDDSDDSDAGDSDDSDDSDPGDGGDSDFRVDSGDSESHDSDDSDAGTTIIVNTEAVPVFLGQGDTLGACAYCPPGDSDDSDDSQGEFGPPDSSDSDDSDSGDSDGSEDGDSDDSDDSQGEFGPPDSDDSDDSDSGDSDGSEDGDSDDSDDSQGEFGPPDSDDSDDSDAESVQVTICHYPPGNPDNSQIITVGYSAVPAHLAHGDVVGASCPTAEELDAECLGSTRVFLIE